MNNIIKRISIIFLMICILIPQQTIILFAEAPDGADASKEQTVEQQAATEEQDQRLRKPRQTIPLPRPNRRQLLQPVPKKRPKPQNRSLQPRPRPRPKIKPSLRLKLRCLQEAKKHPRVRWM